jgi:hypothetical protein
MEKKDHHLNQLEEIRRLAGKIASKQIAPRASEYDRM